MPHNLTRTRGRPTRPSRLATPPAHHRGHGPVRGGRAARLPLGESLDYFRPNPPAARVPAAGLPPGGRVAGRRGEAETATR